MSEMASGIGFIVILIIYFSVGVFAVVGSAVLTQKFLPARFEQAFYALFLMAIAGFYAAFTAYFEASAAWKLELIAIGLFCVLAVFGIRWLPWLIAGYVLHGLWDFVHELQAHGEMDLLELGQMTAIPLAYGVFCATYDIGVSIYFWTRRLAWQEARVIAGMNATSAAFARNAQARQSS